MSNKGLMSKLFFVCVQPQALGRIGQEEGNVSLRGLRGSIISEGFIIGK